LPNPAKYEADRRRDSDFDNHQQHQNHRYLPPELMALGCTSKGYRSVFHATTLVNRPGARESRAGPICERGLGNCYSINNIAPKPQRTLPKSVFWQHSAKVARLRKLEDDIHTARVSIMAEFRRYPLRVEQSKLDGWWFVFVDALPELVVFGPNYEDLLGRLTRSEERVSRPRRDCY
jgi:hypothetical protein